MQDRPTSRCALQHSAFAHYDRSNWFGSQRPKSDLAIIAQISLLTSFCIFANGMPLFYAIFAATMPSFLTSSFIRSSCAKLPRSFYPSFCSIHCYLLSAHNWQCVRSVHQSKNHPEPAERCRFDRHSNRLIFWCPLDNHEIWLYLTTAPTVYSFCIIILLLQPTNSLIYYNLISFF